MATSSFAVVLPWVVVLPLALGLATRFLPPPVGTLSGRAFISVIFRLSWSAARNLASAGCARMLQVMGPLAPRAPTVPDGGNGADRFGSPVSGSERNYAGLRRRRVRPRRRPGGAV